MTTRARSCSARPNGMRTTFCNLPRERIRVGLGIRSECRTSAICSVSATALRASPMAWRRSARQAADVSFSRPRWKRCATSARIFVPPKAIGPTCAVSPKAGRPTIRPASGTLGQAEHASGSFCLCHGDGGNADLLVLASDVLDRPDLRRHAEAAGARALDHFEDARMPWPCGVVGAGETPNLLLGLAGIGYCFLRLYDSRTIPTALLPAALPSGCKNSRAPDRAGGTRWRAMS